MPAPESGAMSIIERHRYLNELIAAMEDGQTKVITGIRRCGKTFLLFHLFREYLRSQGVDDAQVIEVRLDEPDDRELRDPDRLYHYVLDRIVDERTHYVLIDEIQQAISAEEFRAINVARPLVYDVLNGFLNRGNLDVYVSGSNSRFLSTDILTEFRGRGEEIRLHPFSFEEVASLREESPAEFLDEYLRYGGMPDVVLNPDERWRRRYLDSLFDGTYSADIIQRYGIRRPAEMDALARYLASNVGNLTSAANITRGLTAAGSDISSTTTIEYLRDLSESFIVDAVPQAELAGKEILNPSMKYYFEDVGLRNAVLDFPRLDRGRLAENVVYNELTVRGYGVHVGRVTVRAMRKGKREYRRDECDFVADGLGSRVYVQVVWSLEGEGVYEREMRPFQEIGDAYPKAIIVADQRGRSVEPNGVLVLGLVDFLLDEHSIP